LNDTGTTPTVTTQLSEDGKYLSVRVDGSSDNLFMSLFGQGSTNVSSFAETIIEVTELTEVVLVLDTTRSMNYDNRLRDMKRSVNNFLDIIENVETDDKLRVSVVPFGQYVNVGTRQRNEDWLDVPDDWTETFPTTCSMQRGPVTGQTCRAGVTQPTPGRPAQAGRPATSPTYGTCTDDGVSYRCQTSPGSPAQPPRPAVPPTPGGQPTQICSNNYGPDRRVCTTPPPVRHVWHGCVGSRRNAANVDPDYSNGEAKVPGFLDLRCGDDILPLTDNLAQVRRKVNALTTHGETYSPAGLIWGQRMVDFGAPFPLTRWNDDGRAPRRIVIFMTDGFNTRSRSGERHDGTDRREADDVSKTICRQMRDDAALEVYSISFRVSDNRARRLVEECASQPDMYYRASNAARLNEAFEDIAFSLLTPRLTQ
ncbi:MAG: vWA domain-containing protein, partial [Pseudomonadota bacterium]